MSETNTTKPVSKEYGGYGYSLLNLTTVFCLLILACVLGRAVVGPAAIPGTFHAIAKMLCGDRAPVIGLKLSGRLDYALPNVGRPQAVIAAPACLKLPPPPGNPNHEPTYDMTEIMVYIVVTPEQLARLFPDYPHYKASAVENGPVGVGDAALAHLITGEQRAQIERGSQPNEVEYYISTPEMSDRFKIQGSGGKLTDPQDILTGTRYTREPSPSVREAYATTPVIRIPGRTK
jgi:hypothetical protein